MTGGYLRTNWRQTENILNTDALNGQFQYASLWGSAGMTRIYPMVFFSATGTSAAGGMAIGAYSIFSAYFGNSFTALMGNTGSGFKVLPIAIMERGLVTSDSIGNLWFSLCTSDDSVINFYCRTGSISDCSFSFAFQFAGFIISTP